MPDSNKDWYPSQSLPPSNKGCRARRVQQRNGPMVACGGYRYVGADGVSTSVYLREHDANNDSSPSWQLDVSTVSHFGILWHLIMSCVCAQVTVVREDRKPLTPQMVEALSEFNHRICDSYEWKNTGGGNHMDMMKRAVFEDFCRDFSKRKVAEGDDSFGVFGWWANLGEGYRDRQNRH